MSRRKKDPVGAAQQIFNAAAPAAAALLAGMLESEDASVAQRIACAESVLTRALGKTGTQKEETEPVQVTLSPEAAACAR